MPAEQRIVWAVDPFEPVGALHRHATELLRCVRQHASVIVQPVHVLSPAELNLSAEFSGPWVTAYQPAAERAMDRFMRDVGVEGVEKPRILIQTASSTARAVDEVIHFAEAEFKADLILVGTHGRTGMTRLLLGSFAEALLSRSRIPVMVIGPHVKSECKLEHVLFPTDFGEAAKRTFKTVVETAAKIQARLTLYHAIPRPSEPVYQSGVYLMGSPWIPINEYYVHEQARQERRAKSWARWACAAGVPTEVVIDTASFQIAESIVRAARERGAGWIAMAARNGPLMAVILGSVTRQVVRIAECPIWVMHWSRQELSRQQKAA